MLTLTNKLRTIVAISARVVPHIMRERVSLLRGFPLTLLPSTVTVAAMSLMTSSGIRPDLANAIDVAPPSTSQIVIIV